MEFTLDYASLAKKLESQELESANGKASGQVYGQLLAIYLLFNDLTSAKFLWKRIPQEIKESNNELAIIWTVGKLMLKKNYSEIYATIKSFPSWPNHLKNIMRLILESTQQRVTNLINRAYSSISLSTATRILGLSNEDTLMLAQSQGWTYEHDSGYLITNQSDTKNKSMVGPKGSQAVLGLDNGTELLEKLTDYIMFLDSAR